MFFKMKKALTMVFVLLLVMTKTMTVSAAQEEPADLGHTLPIWSIIPFAGMLLSIAVFPLVKELWWEKNKGFVVAFWSLLFIIPFAVCYGIGTAAEQLLEVVFGDYITFIVLLFGLFCVAGNIELKGDIKATPKTNVIMLLIGALLASWIGTTGASMLMIRPIIRANSWRRRRVQVMVFFIFLVSNIGGCLTPVGDPPLLMGFMRGVPFFWSTVKLFPVLLLNVVLLLLLFYILDRRALKKDLSEGLVSPEKKEKEPLRLVGKHNIIFMIMIVAAVILSSQIPSDIGIPIYKDVMFPLSSIVETAIILLAALLSFKTTKKELREENHFTWGAISEVAVLFIGIFITMIPALLILKARGAELGLTRPWQMFWATGALSSFLDNTPTYLVFFTTAGTLKAVGSVVSTTVGDISTKMLMAISTGAVFMGANTYIGNAPNFMVKAIAEENDIKMPSFFGYILWSLSCLIPVFIIDTLVFFL